jgi:outer membrane protein
LDGACERRAIQGLIPVTCPLELLRILDSRGFLYQAQAKEASIRAQAASERSRDLQDRIARDVRTAWLAANTAFRRVAVTRELLNQANLALSLAETRYRLGLSSIVELSQAQFHQTDAAIGNTDAQYQYLLALSTLNYRIGTTPDQSEPM